MSRWAHVTGSVRYDCLYHRKNKLKKLLGKLLSLKYKITNCGVKPDETGHVSSAADTAVLIWGDLRGIDDQDIKDIKEWFNKITCKSGFMIRQAVLEIDDEWSNSISVLTYKPEFDKVEKKFTGRIIERKIAK